MIQLLKFPSVVQELILKTMSIPTVFLISFCSRKAKSLIRSFRWKVSETTFWMFELDDRFSITLGGRAREEIVTNISFQPPTADAKETLKKTSLRIRDPPIKCSLSFELRREPTLWFIKGYELYLPKLKEECHISHCAMVSRMIFFAKFQANSKMLSIDNLFLKKSGRLTGEILQDFVGINLAIFSASFDMSCYSAFLTKWLNDGKTKIRSIIVESRLDVDARLVLEHLDTMKWDPLRRPSHFRYRPAMIGYMEGYPRSFDCSEGFDMVRKSDGMLATVILEERRFCFFVWDNTEGPINFEDSNETRMRFR